MNFLQGTLDVLILNALAGPPLHGYDVVDWIRTTTGGSLEIDDGALYMALHRMEKRGWLAAEWRVTAEGRKQLRAGERDWTKFAAAVSKVFTARS
jgi:PadR family transcriptional regulator PadR